MLKPRANVGYQSRVAVCEGLAPPSPPSPQSCVCSIFLLLVHCVVVDAFNGALRCARPADRSPPRPRLGAPSRQSDWRVCRGLPDTQAEAAESRGPDARRPRKETI